MLLFLSHFLGVFHHLSTCKSIEAPYVMQRRQVLPTVEIQISIDNGHSWNSRYFDSQREGYSPQKVNLWLKELTLNDCMGSVHGKMYIRTRSSLGSQNSFVQIRIPTCSLTLNDVHPRIGIFFGERGEVLGLQWLGMFVTKCHARRNVIPHYSMFVIVAETEMETKIPSWGTTAEIHHKSLNQSENLSTEQKTNWWPYVFTFFLSWMLTRLFFSPLSKDS